MIDLALANPILLAILLVATGVALGERARDRGVKPAPLRIPADPRAREPH